MKKLILFLILIAFLSPSCEDFLDLNPLAQPSSGTFWKTSGDIDLARTALYGGMQVNTDFAKSIPAWDGITDNCYNQYSSEDQNIVNGSINSSSAGRIISVYNGAYSCIARVNIFLDQLNKFTGTIDAAVKTRYLAEARMFRAYYFSYLYRCYGDVPIIDTPADLVTQYKPKIPAADVLTFIMTDIDFAIANLPDITYLASNGSWTKGASQAYKARMLLYTAYDANGNAIASKMAEAKSLLTSINTGFKLAPNYSDNFQDLKQQANPEIMMSVKFLAPNNWHDMDQAYVHWATLSPLSNFIMEFEYKNGKPGVPIPMVSAGSSVVDFKKFTNDSLMVRDPRAYATVFIKNYVVGGVSTPASTTPLSTGMQKFMSPNLAVPFGYSTYSQQDVVFVRYADVLLMLAEAENELNGPTTAAYNAINAIRSRVGMPSLPAGLTKEQMRDRIRHERRVELAFECSRYFDLKRWKIAKQVLNGVTDGLVKYSFLDKHYLWPIPQADIDINNGILVQNPDY